jgi:hypothetical protein
MGRIRSIAAQRPIQPVHGADTFRSEDVGRALLATQPLGSFANAQYDEVASDATHGLPQTCLV